MAAGLPVAAAAVAVAAALPLLAAAGVAVAPSVDDCFTICFKHCIANDKSMTDYCNYACGMTCGGSGGAPPHRRPRLAGGISTNCQLACVRESCRCRPLRADGKDDMEACYGHCYEGCNTKAGMPRPLRAGAVRPAALPDHPFHEMQEHDAVQVQPTSEPDPDDDVSRRARGPLLP
ncbi:unnamed protein product [Urochloa humidicola]